MRTIAAYASDSNAMLLGGLIAGTVDIGAAALINDVSPVRILYFIAGGVLGRLALEGGALAATLGLALQWVMSLLIAAVYVIVSRRFPALRRVWIAGGLAYGPIIFLVMNYAVVPLSAWGRWPHFTAAKAIANLLAMLLFGVIVAYFAKRSVPRPPPLL